MKRFAFAALLLLAGCNVAADTGTAEQGVAQFHQALDAGQFAAIYDGSSAEMKSSISRDDFIKFLSALHTKLGAFRAGKTTNWNDNANTAGHFLTLQRSAQFDKGPGVEEFVFRISGKRAVLAGYHVSSNALVTG